MKTDTSTTAATAAERKTICRYLRLSGEQCTGEAVDPAADILLCTKHAGRVLELLRGSWAPARKGRP